MDGCREYGRGEAEEKDREEATLGKVMIASMGETPQETEDDVLRIARSVDCCLSFSFMT